MNIVGHRPLATVFHFPANAESEESLDAMIVSYWLRPFGSLLAVLYVWPAYARLGALCSVDERRDYRARVVFG